MITSKTQAVRNKGAGSFKPGATIFFETKKENEPQTHRLGKAGANSCCTLCKFLLPHVAKNNPALPLPLIKSNHFYKQIPKANQNILEVLKCWFTSCSSHKGNKGLEIKTVFTVLSKMGKEIMATQMCLDKLCLQFWVYAWLPCYCMGVNFCQHEGQSCCWTPAG